MSAFSTYLVRAIRWAVLASLSGLCFAASVPAQEAGPKPFSFVLAPSDEPIVITANTVIWSQKDNILEMSGRVVVVHPDYRVEAREAQADLAHKTIRLAGNVTVTRTEGGQAPPALTADEVFLNTDRDTGWMVNGRMTVPWQDARFQFQGQRFEKVSDHAYLIENGTFSWCNCQEGERPDWSVSGNKIEADTEGDAVFHGARVNLKNHPAFYLPYFRYPIGADRRSGFLFPLIGTSSIIGAQLELPYYFAINRSLDATVGARWIEKRGVAGGGEFRYNYGEPAAGEIRGFGISDQKEHVPRGGIRFIHRSDLDDRISVAADVAWITDNELLFYFPSYNLGDGSHRALESRLVLSSRRPTMNLTAEFSVFDDLQGGDLPDSLLGPDRDTQMIQRLPALSYTLLTRPLVGPLVFDLQGYAANYWRQEEDLGRGQLLTLMPRLGWPARLGDAVDFFLAAGYREWFLAPDPGFDSRTSFAGRPEAELYSSAQWERRFQQGDLAYRHAIRPALVALYAGRPNSPADDFFAAIIPDRQTELLGLVLDSRLWSRPAKAKVAVPAQMARLELTQLYDFDTVAWRDLRLRGQLGPPTPWRINLDAYYSWNNLEMSRLQAQLGYQFAKNTSVMVGYRKDTGRVLSPYFEFESSPDEALTMTAEANITERNRLTYSAYYSLAFNQLVNQGLGWDYWARQKCWGMNVRVSEQLQPFDPTADPAFTGSLNLRVESPPKP